MDRAVELLKRVVRREIDATLDDLKEHVNFFQCGAGVSLPLCSNKLTLVLLLLVSVNVLFKVQLN